MFSLVLGFGIFCLMVSGLGWVCVWCFGCWVVWFWVDAGLGWVWVGVGWLSFGVCWWVFWVCGLVFEVCG